MPRRLLTFPARIAAVMLFFALLAIQPIAQGDVLPLPSAPEVPVDMWAVTLAPGSDPYLVAHRMGLVVGGVLPGTPDTYIFRGGGELKPLTQEGRQSFDTTLASAPEIVAVQPQVLLERVTRGVEDTITDPLFLNQWHLDNSGQGGGTPGEDANIFAAWNAGYTGTDVVVSSVDDGLYHTNPDLTPNYLPSASWNFVSNNGNPEGGWHGTPVGGVMAAADDGSACGVGAAFNAQLSGIRLLGASTDANEAAALTYQNQVIDIYNNSWGPSDAGSTLAGPGALTAAALVNGITNGRGGLGSIYVWAAGNGANQDNVNADGYANSRYTIAVGGTDNFGERYYSGEQGAPILVNAPTEGGSLDITTTYGTNGCTSGFGGTSSASPLAAGVIALMLDANPNLTWRDVQHILVQTADQNDPTDTGWHENGAGHVFNHLYGFGRVDAGEAAQVAATWVTVDAEESFDSGTIPVAQSIPDGSPGAYIESTFNVTEPLRIESVDVIFNASHTSRGQLRVELVSPSGMVSVLMHGRPDTGDNYTNWRFNSVAHWDEVSYGTWTIRVRDNTAVTTGTFNSWQLQMHGTSLDTTVFEHPASQTVFYDESITLTAFASGAAPISYQWYQGMSGDTSTPVGTDSASFTTPALQADTAYWVRATDTITSDDSNTAMLTVVNGVDMLQDPTFDVMPVPSWIFTTSPWVFSNTEGRIKCNKQYVSANCAAQMRNLNAIPLSLSQKVNLAEYASSLRAGDTLTLTGQMKRSASATGKILLIVKYADAPKTKAKISFTTAGSWQPFTLNANLTSANVTSIAVRFDNTTAPINATVWVDDTQLVHSRTSGGGRLSNESATSASDAVLPPPAPPDDFRGGN